MPDAVIGGIGEPKFCVLRDTEYCENKTFDSGSSTGWTGVGTGALTIDDDLPNFYGDYSALIVDDSAGVDEYAYYTTPSTVPIHSYKTLVTFEHYAVNTDEDCIVKIGTTANGNELAEETFTAKYRRWNRIAIIGAIVGEGSVTIYVTIKPTTGTVSETGSIRITNLSIRSISEEITLDNPPSKESQEFEPKELYDYRTLLGNRRRSLQGYEYTYYSSYDYLSTNDETDRRKLVAADEIFVFPHDDVNWGVYCIWDRRYVMKWLGDKIVGHEGEIQLVSSELLENPQVTLA